MVQLFQEQETSQEQTWKHHLMKAGPVGAGGQTQTQKEAKPKCRVQTLERRVTGVYLH